MLQKILEVEPDLVLADGFDDCLIGLGYRDNWVALYSADKIIDKLSTIMPQEDAMEYFEFNIQGAYVGPKTPIYMWGEDRWGNNSAEGDEKVRSTESWSEAT